MIYVLSQINSARGEDAMHVDAAESSDESEEVKNHVLTLFTYLIGSQEEEEFYSPGSLELLEARRRIAEYSLPRLDIALW